MSKISHLNSYKTCPQCGQRKPSFDFIIDIDENGDNLYSRVCTSCRDALAEEDIGTKQGGLNIDQNAKAFIEQQQEQEHDETQEEKETYIDELDAEQSEKQDKKQRRKKSKSFLERRKKTDTRKASRSKDWSKSTEFGFDADIHDPLRQTPNAAHHKLFVTHPDRMDVKFLLEYVLSGKYSQVLISPTAGVHEQSGLTGGVKQKGQFSQHQTTTGKQARQIKKQQHNAKSAQKQLNKKSRTIKQRFQLQQNNKQQQRVRSQNPSTFMAGSSKATKLHNKQNASSMFSNKTEQTNSATDKLVNFIKSNWGK